MNTGKFYATPAGEFLNQQLELMMKIEDLSSKVNLQLEQMLLNYRWRIKFIERQGLVQMVLAHFNPYQPA